MTAIIISIFTYVQNTKSQKRQVRIGKLEEMLEIIHTLNGNYQYFEDTFFFKELVLKEKQEEEIKRYKKQIIDLIKTSTEIGLRNKLSRLYVLNNSYLPKNKLKDKISVFIACYTSIAEQTISQPFQIIDTTPFNKFPKRWDYLDFTKEIQNEIIKEMKLGYKNNIDTNNEPTKFEIEFRKKYNL